MTLTNRLVNATIKRLTRMVCRVDDGQVVRIPTQGPLIIVSNHINFIEPLVVYTHLLPRPMAFFAKIESWDNKLIGWLFDMWGGIPLKRGSADVGAVRLGLAALENGTILAVAPEGTRSGDGNLMEAHPGVVTMALHSGAPLIPMACYRHEDFWDNITHLRRTDFRIAVGHPFTLQTNDMRATREVRRQMVDEIMYQIAALLPPSYRGFYANLSDATETYLRFPEASVSSLQETLDREGLI
ncbi:MAG: lysophospholipid acyltransferase family protein [Chloroflexota bacterium]|nr:lysophospholipid acyltransferase family protein [Chloroflexota bacterium]